MTVTRYGEGGWPSKHVEQKTALKPYSINEGPGRAQNKNEKEIEKGLLWWGMDQVVVRMSTRKRRGIANNPRKRKPSGGQL